MKLDKRHACLLVEGHDELHALGHLLHRQGIELPDGLIKDCRGFTQLIEAIGVSAKTFSQLGIVIDADLEPKDRWHEVLSKLLREKIDLPTSPSNLGTIIDGLRPDWRIGVWMMPNNSAPGMLESFLASLVPPEDACFPYATDVTREAKIKGAKYNDLHFEKARIHTWLAWQEHPGLPFGTAIRSKYFDTDTPVAIDFVKWFKTLFFDPHKV